MLGALRLTAGTVPGGEPTALRGSGWLGARWPLCRHRLGARLGPGTQRAPCFVAGSETSREGRVEKGQEKKCW